MRTRIYVTRISDWEEIGRAHGEVFGKIRPATAMVEVSRLINPEMLVEIEAEAIVANSGNREASANSARDARARAAKAVFAGADVESSSWRNAI